MTILQLPALYVTLADKLPYYPTCGPLPDDLKSIHLNCGLLRQAESIGWPKVNQID